MSGPSDIDEDWAAMAEEIQSHDCEIRYCLDPLNAFRLVSMLQLAIRHPQLPEGHVELAREMLESAQQYFAGCSAVLRAIEAGFDPRQDRPVN